MKKFLKYAVILAVIYFLSFYRLDYYVTKPGSAFDVSDYVEVVGGDKDDKGSFNLMTVSMYRPNVILYGYAKLKDYYEVTPIEDVRLEGEDDEEYDTRQLSMMNNAQFGAIYNAFLKSNLPYEVNFEGLFILAVIDGSGADGILKSGDEIHLADGQKIDSINTFKKVIDSKKLNDEVKLTIIRDDKKLEKTIQVKNIPGEEDRIGLGISFIENKDIETNPKVEIDTNSIGGPSAGLMMTLEILNQLDGEDITKGYAVAGTGEILEDGSVGRIGGVDKKVVAADEAGMEIFFAPKDKITPKLKELMPDIKTNYEVAVETAKDIKTDMKIVPVETLQDALDYLAKLEDK